MGSSKSCDPKNRNPDLWHHETLSGVPRHTRFSSRICRLKRESAAKGQAAVIKRSEVLPVAFDIVQLQSQRGV